MGTGALVGISQFLSGPGEERTSLAPPLLPHIRTDENKKVG